MVEFDEKQKRIRALLDTHKFDAILLKQSSNFAWATCGAESFINRADLFGVASLLITPVNRYVLTNYIEAIRLIEEQGLVKQGWGIIGAPWYEHKDIVSELTNGMRLAADAAFPKAIDLGHEIEILAHRMSRPTQSFRRL